jgi:four helix bundle protein
MHDFKKMKVWQKSRVLAKTIYLSTSNFPKEELFGLTSQIRRSAVSIVSNIAEGAGRNSDGEFANFLGIANGSSYELDTQIIIALDLGYLTESETDLILKELYEVQKMLYTLILKFKKSK